MKRKLTESFKFSDDSASKNGQEFYKYANQLYSFAQKELKFNTPASCKLVSDPENGKKTLGYTAYYKPDTSEVVIFSDGRHIKDMLRSFAHELVHHAQSERGDLKNTETGEGYAQKDSHMREMEREAYEKGNLIFRDWEDGVKSQQIDEKCDGYGEKDYTNGIKANGNRNVTYYTANNMDVNTEKHHMADVEGHNDKFNMKRRPYVYSDTFEENNQPNAISDSFKQEIISYLNLDNPEEAKKNWIGTAEWGSGEVSFFWVQKKKLFYLVEFSPTYGVEIRNVYSSWYHVNSAGLKNLRNQAGDAQITTFNDKRR